MAQVLFYVILFLLNNVWNKLYEIIQCDQWIGEIEKYFMIDIKKKKKQKIVPFFCLHLFYLDEYISLMFLQITLIFFVDQGYLGMQYLKRIARNNYISFRQFKFLQVRIRVRRTKFLRAGFDSSTNQDQES